MNYKESELLPLTKEEGDKIAEILAKKNEHFEDLNLKFHQGITTQFEENELLESFDMRDEETREFLQDFIEKKVTHKTEINHEQAIS